MNQEIARLRPANVGTTRRVVDLVAPTKAELRAALERRTRAGQVERAWDWRLITEGRMAGSYAVRVVLVPPRVKDPRWATACLRAGWVLLGLAAVMASGAWLLTALTTAALVTLCVTVLALFGAWIWVKYRRRGGTTVDVSVSVHTR